jgi:hypothetical protein
MTVNRYEDWGLQRKAVKHELSELEKAGLIRLVLTASMVLPHELIYSDCNLTKIKTSALATSDFSKNRIVAHLQNV